MLIEYKALVCATEINFSENQLDKFHWYLSKAIDISLLIDISVKEGLAGFLYQSLIKAELLETIRSEHQQRLGDLYRATFRRNLKFINELSLLLDRLNFKKASIVLIGGIALLQNIYLDFGLRPINDMDLWVLPDNYQDLVNSLSEQGFKRDPLYPSNFIKKDIILDIHTCILSARGKFKAGHGLKKQQVEIFKRAGPCKINEASFLCLNPKDQFLQIGFHALEQKLKRLIWLVDIKNMVADWQASDWHALINHAHQMGYKPTVYYMAFLLEKIFDFKLPQEILKSFCKLKPNIFEKKMLGRRVNGNSISVYASLVLISAGKGFSERLLIFKHTFSRKFEVSRHIFGKNRLLRF